MYYPEGMKARVSPVQSIEPHRILATTQDSNQEPPGSESRVVTTVLPQNRAFKICVRPLLEYASTTWSPSKISQITHIYYMGVLNIEIVIQKWLSGQPCFVATQVESNSPKVPWRATEFPRWITTESLWNKKERSRGSPDLSVKRLLRMDETYIFIYIYTTIYIPNYLHPFSVYRSSFSVHQSRLIGWSIAR